MTESKVTKRKEGLEKAITVVLGMIDSFKCFPGCMGIDENGFGPCEKCRKLIIIEAYLKRSCL